MLRQGGAFSTRVYTKLPSKGDFIATLEERVCLSRDSCGITSRMSHDHSSATGVSDYFCSVGMEGISASRTEGVVPPYPESVELLISGDMRYDFA